MKEGVAGLLEGGTSCHGGGERRGDRQRKRHGLYDSNLNK